MRLRAALSLVFFAGFVSHAAGVDIGQVAGHKIELQPKDFEKSLMIDGVAMHTNAIISFDELVQIDGTIVLIGDSSGGGNACDGSPFVVSFPPVGAPRFDGPLDNCIPVRYTVEGNKVTFSTGNIPGRETERWEWTPTAGFTTLPAIPFAPDASAGWGKLRERQMGHPSAAFANGEIATSIRLTLGSKFEGFQELMNGVGGGEFRGDDYVGTSCRPHACSDEAGLLFLSAHDRKVYAAWKPEGEKIAVFPSPVKLWPEKAKAELRKWARQWD